MTQADVFGDGQAVVQEIAGFLAGGGDVLQADIAEASRASTFSPGIQTEWRVGVDDDIAEQDSEDGEKANEDVSDETETTDAVVVPEDSIRQRIQVAAGTVIILTME